MPIVCAALDYQGGDSGQITSGGWGRVLARLTRIENLFLSFRFYLSVQVGPARFTRTENLFSSFGFYLSSSFLF